VAAAVLFGFPRPVKVVEFGAGGERLAGKVLGLGLFLDEQDEESGTAGRRVIFEMVHLRSAVVELQGKGDGHGTLGDGDLVGRRAAVGGNEGRRSRGQRGWMMDDGRWKGIGAGGGDGVSDDAGANCVRAICPFEGVVVEAHKLLG